MLECGHQKKIRGGTVENRKVAGIVMLHLEDGAKRFLLHSTGNALELAYADYSEGKTGLANILELLKSTVELDVKKIDLVELTNGQINRENVPMFVFEAEEAAQKRELPAGYYWEEPQKFREIIRNYDIEGMPYF